jgi:hypothetical protein
VNNSKSGLLVVVAILLVLVSVSPAYAEGTVRAVIENWTGETVRVSLNGPMNIVIKVEPNGKKGADLVTGIYAYQYHACGKTYTGNFIVTQSGDTLRIAICPEFGSGPGQTGNAFILIENKTKEPFTITLKGPFEYTITVEPGTEKIEVIPGKYTYSLIACGVIVKGSLKTKISIINTIKIEKCKNSGGGPEDSELKTMVLVVENRMDAPMYLTLVGPQTYRFTIPVGKMKLEVEKGIYQYTMMSNACGGPSTETGKINLLRSKVWRWWCD